MPSSFIGILLIIIRWIYTLGVVTRNSRSGLM
jgi:hypothetical protein